ncbi:MAG: hypothetical protein EYC62_02055 [Alphaproteobacteria bacterium]|nr:MAG: hypothetical protein EYC62_02055 [Alphaproteobacteria bacterium]
MASGGGAKGRLGDHINDLISQRSSALTKAVGIMVLAGVFLIGGSAAVLGFLGKAAATVGVMGIPTAWGLLASSPIFIGLGVAFFREAGRLGQSIESAQIQYSNSGTKGNTVHTITPKFNEGTAATQPSSRTHPLLMTPTPAKGPVNQTSPAKAPQVNPLPQQPPGTGRPGGERPSR